MFDIGRTFFDSVLSRTHLTAFKREKSFVVNRVEAREFARLRFAEMLVEASNGETIGEIAADMAPILQLTKRQIENYLKGDSSPAFEHVVVVGTILGIWRTMEICTLGKNREEVAKLIGQGSCRN